MNQKKIKWFSIISVIISIVLSCYNMGVYAEGGTCPAGYYPQNSPGVNGCIPIPGYGTQQVYRQAPPFNSGAIFSPAQLKTIMDEHNREQLEVKKFLIQNGLTEEEVEALKEGSWRIYQEGEQTTLGQKCNAVWVSAMGVITIGTTGGLNDPALLIYTSDKIPKSTKQVSIKAHINVNGKEQDAHGIMFTLPNSNVGSIFFSLQSLKAAIGDMKDTGEVTVDVDGKVMVDIMWDKGFEAKKKLAKCANAS